MQKKAFSRVGVKVWNEMPNEYKNLSKKSFKKETKRALLNILETEDSMSKCDKNKKVAHEAQPSVSLMFLSYFDVLCDLLLTRRTATWNLFVLYNKNRGQKF